MILGRRHEDFRSYSILGTTDHQKLPQHFLSFVLARENDPFRFFRDHHPVEDSLFVEKVQPHSRTSR